MSQLVYPRMCRKAAQGILCSQLAEHSITKHRSFVLSNTQWLRRSPEPRGGLLPRDEGHIA
jgi:hypothetical protein